LFQDKPYYSLENPDTLRQYQLDPRSFLTQHPQGMVLDEVQRSPDIFSYLQGLVDRQKQMGQYIVTGSQQFGLLEKVTQSLAGRAGLVDLLPLSYAEISNVPALTRTPLNELLWRGGYPSLYDRRRNQHLVPQQWFSSYFATYVERDVRQVLQVRDSASFLRFLRLCAHRAGQLLNVQNLAVECGISTSTANQWLSVLQASYIIRLLPPWFENFGKRLVKMSKLYFYDTGLLCWLLGIESAQQLSFHAMRGAIFENWVLLETIKHRCNQGLRADVYFWRDNHGVEVDLLFEHHGLLHPVEIKSGTTFQGEWLKNIRHLQKYGGARIGQGSLVYGGSERFNVQGVQVMNWASLSAS
jgi:predicted AAA+ superfamily ATPase